MVTAKGHRDSFTTTQLLCINGSCNPIITQHPECWKLDLSKDSQARTVCVDPSTHDRTQLGDYYKEEK